MSSTVRALRVIVVLLAMATCAPAQDRRKVPPTADERAWARRVAAALDLPEGTLTTIQRKVEPKGPSPFGVGVRLQWSTGLAIERVRFPSLELARAFEEGQPPEKAVDRRQRETLFVEGVAPETVAARDARRAGWTKIEGAAQALAAERSAAPPRVVVVAIDARTIAGLGPFGGQYRAHHARLIAALDSFGARGVAFDLFFPENPQTARATEAMAYAAAKSQAPVVIATNTELDATGQTLLEPNANALQGVRTGAVLSRTELVVEPGVGGRAGEQVIAAESGGLKSLIFVLGEAAGVLNSSELERLGLVEEVTVGAELVGGQPRAVTTPAIRPSLRAARPSNVVSYVDVMERRIEPSAIRDALVIVGIDDGAHDLFEAPNPDAPHVARIAGVHLHAAALQRALVAQHRGRPLRRAEEQVEDDAEIAALAAAEEQRYLRGARPQEEEDELTSPPAATKSVPRRK